MKARIGIKGNFTSISALGYVARTLYRTLRVRGNYLLCVEQTGPKQDHYPNEEELRRCVDGETSVAGAGVVVHAYPPPWKMERDAVNVAWSMASTPLPSEEVVKEWRKCDVLIVPSSQMQVGIKRLCPESHCSHLRFPVDIEGLCDAVEPIPIIGGTHEFNGKRIAEKPHVFGMSCTWIPRSGIESVLCAYFSTFSKKENVILVLKVNVADKAVNSQKEVWNYVRKIRRKCGNPYPADVLVVLDALNEKEFVGLIKGCDTLIVNSKWDALQSGMHYAFGCRTLVVGPDYEGRLEACQQDRCFLTAARLEPVVSPSERGIEFGQMWYEISVADLGEKMRSAYECGKNDDLAERVRERARAYVEEYCASGIVATQLLGMRPIEEVITSRA